MVGSDFAYASVPGTHQWYDGTPHPWEFARVWHLEPSLHDVDVVYAGVEDAAMFKSTDGGDSWAELKGLREHGSGSQWQPGAGGMCLHTIIQHPTDADRLWCAISAAGVFGTSDGGVDVGADEQGPDVGGDPVDRGGGRALRAQPRDAPVGARDAVHAEALGREPQRRRRRLVDRGQRQPA